MPKICIRNNSVGGQLWIKCLEGDSFTAPELLFGATRQTRTVNVNFGRARRTLRHRANGSTRTLTRATPALPPRLPLAHQQRASNRVLASSPAATLPLRFSQSIEALQGSAITPHLFISEVRSIAADEFWMSPCYGRDSVSIHFTWKHHEADAKSLLPVIERALAEFDPRALIGVRCLPWRLGCCRPSIRRLSVFGGWRGG